MNSLLAVIDGIFNLGHGLAYFCLELMASPTVEIKLLGIKLLVCFFMGSDGKVPQIYYMHIKSEIIFF